jgi:ribonuclease BN (tRNA processing enzyme)
MSERTVITILGSLGGQNETQLNGACCRAGTAVAVVVDGGIYLLDCGVGTVVRLLGAGLELGDLRHVFITHHHADHNADLSTLLTLAYTSGAPAITVHGPTPTGRFITNLRSLHRPTIDTAQELGAAESFTRRTRANEFGLTGAIATTGEEIHRDAAVTVHAHVVDHGGMPSVAYRFETPDRKIVFSGDTGGQVSLVEFTKGCDTLVHEVIDYPTVYAALVVVQGGASQTFLDHLKNDHSSPEVCGRTATQADVETLVLYHLTPGSALYPEIAWKAQVAPHYSGRVVVASDLLRI